MERKNKKHIKKYKDKKQATIEIIAKNLLSDKKCQNCIHYYDKEYFEELCVRTHYITNLKYPIPVEQTCRFWDTEKEEFDGTWYAGYDGETLYEEDENKITNKENARNLRKLQKQTIKTKMKGIY